jgi:hypothetical protein
MSVYNQASHFSCFYHNSDWGRQTHTIDSCNAHAKHRTRRKGFNKSIATLEAFITEQEEGYQKASTAQKQTFST